jgi:Flp pilus assembly protein TadD
MLIRRFSAIRFIIAMSLVCGLAACAGTSTQPPAEEPTAAVSTPEEARSRAAEALAKGDTELALRSYVEAADLDPTDAESLYQIGAIYEQRRDNVLAARAFARAVQADPDHARALEALGLRYFDDKQLEQAQPLLERAVAASPDRWRAHNALGVIADSRGDHAAAATRYAAALAVRPGSTAVINNRGYSSYLAGNLAAAERDFRAVLSVDPEYQRAWQNLGLIYARRGEYGTAVDTISRVVSRHVATNDVGYIAMVGGDYAYAELLFTEAIRLSPVYYETANQNLAELRRRRAEGPVTAGAP